MTNLGKTMTKRPVSAPNIIAVASGKGGVGKTWFSITLAHSLAKQGKKVLLFDGDIGLANVDIQLGLMPKHDLLSVLDGKISMRRAITKFETGNFDIIAGQSGTATLSNLPNEKVVAIRDGLIDLASEYDHVVIDLGAGIDRPVRILSSCAAQVFVVTNEEPTSLTDAYAFIKLTHAAGLAETVSIVVNQVPAQKDGDRVYNTLLKACENFLKIHPPLAGMIRQDKKVLDAIRNQTSIITRHPNSNASIDVESIAAKAVK